MNSISFSDLIALWIASLVQSCSPREGTLQKGSSQYVVSKLGMGLEHLSVLL